MIGNFEYCGLDGDYKPDAWLQRYVDAGLDEDIKACETKSQLVAVLRPIVKELRARASKFRQSDESFRTALSALRYHIYIRELSQFNSDTVYDCIKRASR